MAAIASPPWAVGTWADDAWGDDTWGAFVAPTTAAYCEHEE
jgi:hypothetical protein